METNYINRINQAVWTTTSYIQPHEYVVRDRYPDLCDLISGLIHEEGYTNQFQGRDCQYIDLDGYKYWFIFPVLNRELLHLTIPGAPEPTITIRASKTYQEHVADGTFDSQD